jgi:hypothetical protein
MCVEINDINIKPENITIIPIKLNTYSVKHVSTKSLQIGVAKKFT